jgi:hypothetical protein
LRPQSLAVKPGDFAERTEVGIYGQSVPILVCW